MTSQLTSYRVFLNQQAFIDPPPPAATPLLSSSTAPAAHSLSSSQDFTELTASSGSFIPTVTAISTSPDLQWMVQPLISSVAPSHKAQPYTSSPTYSRVAMRSASRTHNSTKRGRMEQVATVGPSSTLAWLHKYHAAVLFFSPHHLSHLCVQISPEEEEKKRIRRERNKQAAAKCRNRRRELTDTLQAVSLPRWVGGWVDGFLLSSLRPSCRLQRCYLTAKLTPLPLPLSSFQETDKLEDEKSGLQNDIANLMKEKERLEFILAAHQPICKIPSELDSDFSVVSLSPATSVSSQPQTTVTSSRSTFSASSNSIFSSSGGGPALSTATVSAGLVRMSDLDSSVLEESLDLMSKTELETARSVPEVDLSSSLYAPQDWEPLHGAAANADLEPLCTPVVTCTPACTTFTSSFVFTFPEADAFPTCGVAHRRGSNSNEQSSDSLSSPTLLAL